MELDQRIAYSAVADRPALSAPNGARLLVWPIVVLEKWEITRPMPRQIVPPSRPTPDYLNWSWHEYGMRVGFWRLQKLFDSHGIKPSVSINSAVCTAYPKVAAAARDAGWEFVGHGVVQRPVAEVTDESAMIAQCMREISAFTGRKVRGWASPGIAQAADSLDRLAAAGIEYACDWVFDDQPFELATKSGRSILAIPYSVDLNDVPAIAIGRQSADEFRQNICDAFDRLYAEGAESTRILTLVLHPYICATSHRIGYLERAFAHIQRAGVLFWNGEQILDWYRGMCKAT